MLGAKRPGQVRMFSGRDVSRAAGRTPGRDLVRRADAYHAVADHAGHPHRARRVERQAVGKASRSELGDNLFGAEGPPRSGNLDSRRVNVSLT